MATRWRWPPDSWPGRASSTEFGRPTISMRSSTRRSRDVLSPTLCTTSGSISWSCTLMRAFSAVAGSWNTTEITRPMRRRCAAERFVTSSPLKNTLPDVGCCKPHITLAVVDLPQPDSPTMPKVSPGMSLRVRPRTACTLFGCRMEPVRVLNVTRMSSRKMMGVGSPAPVAGWTPAFTRSCSLI